MARQDNATGRISGSSSPKAPSKGAANALAFFGFLLFASGAALGAAPRLPEQVQEAARLLAQAGLESGVLLIGGLTLFGLGLTGRMVVSALAHAPEPEEDPFQVEVRLFNEQVAAKLAQLRTSLLQISEDVATLGASQQAYFQKQAETGGNPDHQQDALFRLAASLDKLNAHLDERIHGIDLLLRSGLENLTHVVQESRHFVEQCLKSSHPGQRPESADVHVLVDLQEQHGRPAPGSIDFFETMEKLDSLSGTPGQRAPAPAPRGRTHPQPPFPASHPAQASDALDALLPDDFLRGHDERY
jgi:hypothetical protein